MDTMNEAQHEGLTTTQDKVLSILPIPSAILSIFGSSVILYMAISTRRQRQWTTYTRLLIGLSMCDIISSASLAFAAFLRRPESGRVWAVGNDATCTAMGTMIQFSYSNLFYNAMLSYYFMTTVRFQMKHSRIAKVLEPWMHFVSIGYPLITSVVGASCGMYGEKATGMGCWVNEYPHGCGDEPGQEPCTSGLIGWLYLGLPLLFSGFSILINNLIIGCYVWTQHTPIKSSSRSRNDTANSFSSSPSDEVANKKVHVTKQEQGMNKHQMRRLRLVRSQAFWFVVSYAICNVWLGTLGIAEAMTLEENEPKLMQTMYTIMVINAFFAPLQGFLNMLVYIRPKYLKNRQDFPLETNLWATRRAIFGERVRAHRFLVKKEEKSIEQQSVEPTKADVETPSAPGAGESMKDIESNQSGSNSLPKDKRLSSITLSHWDQFDQDSSEGSDDRLVRSERWVDGAMRDVSNAVPTARRQSQPHVNFHSSISSLPLITEYVETELDVDSTFSVDDTITNADCVDAAVSMNQSSEDRWGSTAAELEKASQNLDGFHPASHASPLVVPIRAPSEHDELATARMWAASMGFQLSNSNPNDSPLIIPQRLSSGCETAALETDKEVTTKRSTSPHLSPVPPRRVPSDCEMLDEPERPASPNLSPTAPKWLSSKHDLVVETGKNESAVNKKRSASPNLSPIVPPRRVPTDYENSGELSQGNQ